MAKAEYRSAVRSRKLINDALADLLAEKPLEKITVTDVVRRADINRGTFYAHYRDIPDVVDHLIQQTFSAIRDAMLANLPAPADLGSALLLAIQAFLEEDLDFYRKLLNSSAFNVMQEQLVAVVLEFMLEYKDQFFDGTDAEYQATIHFCAGGLSLLYRDWFSGKLTCSLHALTQMCDTLIRKVIGKTPV